MVVASIATHFNSRASVARQSAAAAANPQAAIMNKLALWVFPLGVLVGGPFLPIAILIYWVSNNIWTYGQQHLVFGKIEKEEEAKKAAVAEKRAANAPKPGAKPVNLKKKGATPAGRYRRDRTTPKASRESEPTKAITGQASGGEAVGPTAKRRAETAREPRPSESEETPLTRATRDPTKRNRTEARDDLGNGHEYRRERAGPDTSRTNSTRIRSKTTPAPKRMR